MSNLEPADKDWARLLGVRYGAWWPNLQASTEELTSAFKEYLEQPVADVKNRHARRVGNIPAHVPLSSDQLSAGTPYGFTFAETAIREMRRAVWWRREAVTGGLPDPGSEWENIRAEPQVGVILAGWGPDITDSIHVYLEGSGLAIRPLSSRDQRKLQGDAKEARLSHRLYLRQLLGRDPSPDPNQWLIGPPDGPRYRRGNGVGLTPAPLPQPYGVNHQGAEHLAADWMRYLGAHDATVTQFSGDGGVDVESRYLIAQVKNLNPSSTVPFAAVRDLYGTAAARGKWAVLLTSGGITREGLAFANHVGMVVLRYDAMRGTLVGLNDLGALAASAGFAVALAVKTLP